MAKKPDWYKILKAIGIIAIIAAIFLFFESGSQKHQTERENIYDSILSISEELHELSLYAEDSLDYDEENMQVSLYHLQEECSRLSSDLEKLSHYFDEPEYDENRRNWWY